MTVRLLDVSTMPFEQTYVCDDGSEINLNKFLDSYYDTVQVLAASGLVKANESFGFAMAEPNDDFDAELWDKPEEFVWFVGGWGPDRDRYIANAIRKMRALLRPHEVIAGYGSMGCDSTLELRFDFPEYFRDKVDSQNEVGTFPWGDFPWGGAAFVQMGDLILAGAVSALSEIEDDLTARLILGGFGKLIVQGNNLLPDD